MFCIFIMFRLSQTLWHWVALCYIISHLGRNFRNLVWIISLTFAKFTINLLRIGCWLVLQREKITFWLSGVWVSRRGNGSKRKRWQIMSRWHFWQLSPKKSLQLATPMEKPITEICIFAANLNPSLHIPKTFLISKKKNCSTTLDILDMPKKRKREKVEEVATTPPDQVIGVGSQYLTISNSNLTTLATCCSPNDIFFCSLSIKNCQPHVTLHYREDHPYVNLDGSNSFATISFFLKCWVAVYSFFFFFSKRYNIFQSANLWISINFATKITYLRGICFVSLAYQPIQLICKI